MEALVVERSEDGYWTHPEYANLFGDSEPPRVSWRVFYL